MIGRGSAADQRGPRTPAAPSFKSIYVEYFDFVWSSARRLGVAPAAMDDVVQEIFVVIHRRLHTLEQPESLRSWIYSVVRRTVSSYHRSRRSRNASDTALAHHVGMQIDAQLTPLDLAEQNEEAKLLWAVLDEIDARKREVLILVEFEGLTVPEIAEALEIPLNTAYSRLRAGRIAFEAGLARRAARGEGGERS